MCQPLTSIVFRIYAHPPLVILVSTPGRRRSMGFVSRVLDMRFATSQDELAAALLRDKDLRMPLSGSFIRVKRVLIDG